MDAQFDERKADNGPEPCRSDDNATLPRHARLSINRCNLPAVILGSTTFQKHPSALCLDGVAELHDDLFRRLDACADPAGRVEVFRDYVTVRFCLEELEEAGLSARSKKRANANWVRMVRGWSFDSDGREGAVLKGWVESRFGLLPRYHREALRDFSGPAYLHYLEMRSAGLYGTNALEGQLDLLFTFTQYEFQRQGRLEPLKLYRGINRFGDHEVLSASKRDKRILLNSLSSFTSSRERASEFGDYIMEATVPVQKVFFHCGLLPGVLKGEDEFLVIGGVYDVRVDTH